jgi:16S rRNA processing protein RimM
MAVVGRIARTHGLNGQVVVDTLTDFPEQRFRKGAEIFVERGGRIEPLTLTSVRFQRERPVIGIAGIDTIDAAEALRGLELRIPVERLTPLPAGAYYHHDLVGCAVETRSGEVVGTVREIDRAGGGARLVVAGARGEVLIPLAEEICTTIDPAAKRIVIDPPEGLLDLNAR